MEECALNVDPIVPCSEVPLPPDSPPPLQPKAVYQSEADGQIDLTASKSGALGHENFVDDLLHTLRQSLKQHSSDLLDSVQKCISQHVDGQVMGKAMSLKRPKRPSKPNLFFPQTTSVFPQTTSDSPDPAKTERRRFSREKTQPDLGSSGERKSRPLSPRPQGQVSGSPPSISEAPSGSLTTGPPHSIAVAPSGSLVSAPSIPMAPTGSLKSTLSERSQVLPGAICTECCDTEQADWVKHRSDSMQSLRFQPTPSTNRSRMAKGKTTNMLSLDDRPKPATAHTTGYVANLLVRERTESASHLNYNLGKHKPAVLAKMNDFIGFSEKMRQYQKRARLLIDNRRYKAFGALVMALDLVMLYLDIDRVANFIKDHPADAAQGVPDDWWFVAFFDVVCVLLLLDLLLRAFAHQHKFFSEAPMFRSFLVISNVAFVVSSITQHLQIDERAFSHFRNAVTQLAIFRVFRLFNVFHVIDNLRGLTELRIIIHGVSGALMPLVWSGVMIVSILISVAMIFTEGASYFLITQSQDPDSDEARLLRKNFGDCYTSALSLFKSMSGGDDWGIIYETMYPMNRFYRGLYLGFLVFSIFGLLNIVTAVFVDTAMQRSRNDRQLQIDQQMTEKTQFLQSMQHIFNELDSDHNDSIDLAELTERMKDARVGAYFSSLGVDVDEVQKLFKLLDADGSGNISSEEFMFGCLRLRGEAKSLDVAIVHAELQWIKHNLAALGQTLEDILDTMDDEHNIFGSETDDKDGTAERQSFLPLIPQ